MGEKKHKEGACGQEQEGPGPLMGGALSCWYLVRRGWGRRDSGEPGGLAQEPGEPGLEQRGCRGAWGQGPALGRSSHTPPRQSSVPSRETSITFTQDKG